MQIAYTLIMLVSLMAASCTSTTGQPVSEDELNYRKCEKYFDCGQGRYCSQEGLCWSDCRTSADCVLLDKGPLCNMFGECVEPGGTRDCVQHADCEAGIFCNGRCSSSGSACGSAEDCPFDGDTCKGKCAPACATENDCIGFEESELECTPVGQCLLPGWEQWIPAGQLPPSACTRDSHCKALGWNWICDCDKETDPFTGLEVCTGGAQSICAKNDTPLELGDGPSDSPAHSFRGIWGMRMEIAVVTLGLPLVTKQNTYSSNLILVKASHKQGDTLELEEKLCDIQLTNFIDTDEPFDDLAWMVIPLRYLRSLPIAHQTVQLHSASDGDAFDTSRSLEIRGCVLQDPENDPLPDRHDFDANPDDSRFWDEDGDGNVAITTLMDGVLRGAIYNVQRWSAEYHGTILDSDHIKGLSSIENEQLVIFASNPTLVYDTETEIHPQEDRTYFRLERLNDDASCADLIRQASRDDSWLRHTPHLSDVADPK